MKRFEIYLKGDDRILKTDYASKIKGMFYRMFPNLHENSKHDFSFSLFKKVDKNTLLWVVNQYDEKIDLTEGFINKKKDGYVSILVGDKKYRILHILEKSDRFPKSIQALNFSMLSPIHIKSGKKNVLYGSDQFDILLKDILCSKAKKMKIEFNPDDILVTSSLYKENENLYKAGYTDKEGKEYYLMSSRNLDVTIKAPHNILELAYYIGVGKSNRLGYGILDIKQ